LARMSDHGAQIKSFDQLIEPRKQHPTKAGGNRSSGRRLLAVK
jgi:hypothetical protein